MKRYFDDDVMYIQNFPLTIQGASEEEKAMGEKVAELVSPGRDLEVGTLASLFSIFP